MGSEMCIRDSRKADESNPGEIGATLSGSVVKILVKNGQSVAKGEPLIVTEAMKMETTIIHFLRVVQLTIQWGIFGKQTMPTRQ